MTLCYQDLTETNIEGSVVSTGLAEEDLSVESPVNLQYSEEELVYLTI